MRDSTEFHEDRDLDEESTADAATDVPRIDEQVDDTDDEGLPDYDFLGVSPGDANEETPPGAPPVPHGG
jgi:hypothetical protein